MPRRRGNRLKDVRQGVGPMIQRRYTVRVLHSALTAAQLIDRLCGDLNAASPTEFAVFDKTSGSQCMAEGDEYVVHLPGPWNGPIRVVERHPLSFRFATMRGHIEAGEIEFRALDTPEHGLVFVIQSWSRSSGRLADVLYDRLRIAKEMQLHMWVHFCTRIVDICGGQMTGKVEVCTERAMVPGDTRYRPKTITRALTAVFTRVFSAAARLRGGRPLHPSGLVFDATLRLYGSSRFWGVPFLDREAELRCLARLSRSIGLPLALPDVLGLALRWQEPALAASGNGCRPERDATATAELLLATTGRSRLGRHLLWPARKWSPAFYGSLLPYEAADRRVLFGAVARPPRTIPAGDAALAHAVDARPLSLDLVVATPLGRWERFGELRITGPPRRDDGESVRFDPARHPIPRLRPAGLLQQVRGPTYAAVHQVTRHAGDTAR